MIYKIAFAKRAAKEFNTLPVNVIKQVAKALDGLKENPRPLGCKKLKGESEALWRIRVGDYRVIYFIEDTIKIIEVRRVGHRRDIYM